jgi:hypothetical protein
LRNAVVEDVRPGVVPERAGRRHREDRVASTIGGCRRTAAFADAQKAARKRGDRKPFWRPLAQRVVHAHAHGSISRAPRKVLE